jgi:eukaryotic-like serine/threonine-protein kinase
MDQPTILDRYRLLERLATGGSAEVWRAYDDQLDRPVAVKRLHAHLLPDERSRKRLAAEARVVAQLSHPVIVDVYDVDVDGDAPVIVMELVEGESLASRIARDGPLPPREAALLGADLADALYHAHQRGVIHRDVKPGNVLLDEGGRTRLVDFGIARSLAESAERLTLTGTVVGTLSAIAPEQLAGEPTGPKTDIYGLGVVLHEALTGAPPYAATSPLALAEAQAAGPPTPPGVPAPLAALLAACLSPRPEDRPVHAGAVAGELRAWTDGIRSEQVPAAVAGASAADTGAVTLPMAAIRSDEPADPRDQQRSGPWRSALVALSALLAAALFLAVVTAGPPGGTGSPTATPVASALAATDSPTASAAAAPAVDVELPGWAEKLAEKFEKECGEPFDPRAIAGLEKREAERQVDPQIKECKERRDD